jgi:hypothetical protein
LIQLKEGETVKKIFLIALLVLAWAGSVWAAPFLVANPEGIVLTAGQTLTYNVSGLPTTFTSATNIPADSTGTYAFALDISTLAAGSYTVTATACLNDPVQGQVCSAASSPFTFARIGPPAAPSNLGLATKQ